ncbi:DNA protecting protein DprA [candidate division Kazan bacterium RBG_13_50_9]|uniref:DNA protecting protein DprA n=1 Tax=candidate division Kazan bacterium RBG_13_50_9 TaxID=1798535 RepID=A0A1F4NSZ0_UNCK3|nr:MAG: DNA protecting protein DprA [candidate division Kazan bacterium RBG_13_50_9]
MAQIPDPPLKLFVWGDPAILSSPALAIVGTRKPTDYGIRAAAYFARQLAGSLVIVSGIAYGIDTVALAEAAGQDARPVVAIIGSGLNREDFYPQANWNLALKIVEQGGAIISEYPPGMPPQKHHFPARNRIIAGLSRGVLVVEGGENSGALITAHLALDYNREVFALAGSVFVPQAVGVNQLIREGAGMVTHPDDILIELGLPPSSTGMSVASSLSAADNQILQLLNEQAMSVDEIAKSTQLDSAGVSSTLTLMEIEGLVKSIGAGKFTRLR